MKKRIFLFAASLLLAQSGPTSRINSYTPNLKIIWIGAERCSFWFHSPDPAHTQIACFDSDGTNPYNAIIIPQKIGHESSWVFPDGTISWLLTDSTFDFAARGSGDTTESKLKGTF